MGKYRLCYLCAMPYDPYGRVTIRNLMWTAIPWEWSCQNEILFCGYRYDPETGLYNVRHRVYHPTLGRWVQRDPAGYVDGPSMYQYGISDPAGYVDWLGTQTTCSQPATQPATQPAITWFEGKFVRLTKLDITYLNKEGICPPEAKMRGNIQAQAGSRYSNYAEQCPCGYEKATTTYMTKVVTKTEEVEHEFWWRLPDGYSTTKKFLYVRCKVKMRIVGEAEFKGEGGTCCPKTASQPSSSPTSGPVSQPA